MNKCYTVLVFKLTDEKLLLCPTQRHLETDDNKSLITESEFLYSDITLNNRIVNMVEAHKNIEAWQIDGLVHMYMHKYGTNNVYGGSYVSDNPNRVSVSDHIKFITEGVIRLENRRDTYNKLKNHICNHGPANIKKYDQLCILNSKYHVNRDIINELEWLKRCIYNNGIFNLTRYHACISHLRFVYENASKLFNLEQTIYHKKPELFFDSRIIPYERTAYMYNPANDDKLEPMIKSFELAIYSMINREDETLFDMEQINIQENNDCYIMRQLIK